MSDCICLKCMHKQYCATGIHQPRAFSTITGCSKYEERNPFTNADRIRSMSDEELAMFIRDTALVDGVFCPYEKCKRKNCGECLLDWLREEASDA